MCSSQHQDRLWEASNQQRLQRAFSAWAAHVDKGQSDSSGGKVLPTPTIACWMSSAPGVSLSMWCNKPLFLSTSSLLEKCMFRKNWKDNAEKEKAPIPSWKQTVGEGSVKEGPCTYGGTDTGSAGAEKVIEEGDGKQTCMRSLP